MKTLSSSLFARDALTSLEVFRSKWIKFHLAIVGMGWCERKIRSRAFHEWIAGNFPVFINKRERNCRNEFGCALSDFHPCTLYTDDVLISDFSFFVLFYFGDHLELVSIPNDVVFSVTKWHFAVQRGNIDSFSRCRNFSSKRKERKFFRLCRWAMTHRTTAHDFTRKE